jgi:hypothetical protein
MEPVTYTVEEVATMLGIARGVGPRGRTRRGPEEDHRHQLGHERGVHRRNR